MYNGRERHDDETADGIPLKRSKKEDDVVWDKKFFCCDFIDDTIAYISRSLDSEPSKTN